MKIIFDSEEQKNNFNDNFCPSDFCYDDKSICKIDEITCEKCLERFIEMEVGATHGL